MTFLQELLQWIGAGTLAWLGGSCVASYLGADPLRSRDIRRRTWTQDERDRQRQFNNIVRNRK